MKITIVGSIKRVGTYCLAMTSSDNYRANSTQSIARRGGTECVEVIVFGSGFKNPHFFSSLIANDLAHFNGDLGGIASKFYRRDLFGIDG